MPLKGRGKKGAQENIRKLYHEHGGEAAWPRDRIIAAGMNAAGVGRKSKARKRKKKP